MTAALWWQDRPPPPPDVRRDIRESCPSCGGSVHPHTVDGWRARQAIEARALTTVRGELQGLVADTGRDLAWARRALTWSLGLLCSFVARPRERVVDIEAERRVLGAILAGHVGLDDLAELEPEYFAGPGHRTIFAIAVSVLEEREERDDCPRWLSFRYLGHGKELTRKLAARAGLDDPAIEGALERLIVPAAPHRAIDLVAALGRRWRT